MLAVSHRNQNGRFQTSQAVLKWEVLSEVVFLEGKEKRRILLIGMHYFSGPTRAQGHAMNQITTERSATPVDQSAEPEVLGFRPRFDQRSPLDEIVREGARRMLQEAIETEVTAFIDHHQDRRDAQGRRLVVRNGSLPAREILTGAGPVEVRQGRVRDKSPRSEDRVHFTPSVLPAYLRRTEAVEELIPWLYLKGISTGDFSEALQSLVGEKAKGLSANVIVRLKEQWSAGVRGLDAAAISTDKQYVYVWADGIYVKVRLEDDANQRQCMLVLMGATADGTEGTDRRAWTATAKASRAGASCCWT